MIKIEIMQEGRELRDAFIKKFLLTWEEFQMEYGDFLENMKEKHYEFKFEDALMWDRMPRAYQEPTYAEALAMLRELGGEVYFLAEPNGELCFDGMIYQNYVARANAAELARLIEYDWYESLKAEDYFYNAILPPDLYVFDASMTHLIVFTHENDPWDFAFDDPHRAAEARYCIAYGFFGEKRSCESGEPL